MRLTDLLLGASLMYFFDPARGRKRRARITDAATHAQRVERALVGKAVRDARHRAHGLAERVRHPLAADVPDVVVEGRVRAQLGRVASHPRAIEVEVDDGRVVLRGPILAAEADHIVRYVERIPGVNDVIDRLERHAEAGSIPGLQGEGRRRARTVWPPALQLGAIGTGAVLAGYGLARRGPFGLLATALGGVLVARGQLNRPLGFDREHGIVVHKTIHVDAPVDRVFDLWSDLDNFPRFMDHVRDIRIEGRRSYWEVDGPAGAPLGFVAETTRHEPDRVIAWRTLPRQAIEHEGVVRFEEVDGGTRVQVHMSYRPPAGVVGHAIARILGWDPKKRMDEDLIKMKALLESGHTRAKRHRFDISDLH